MQKTIKIPKISLQRIPIEMSCGQPEQVVKKMEENEAGKEKQPETPTKRTTVKGSGAGPLSAKKKTQKPKRKPPKPVKVATQAMIEVVGNDGKLYAAPMPAA